MLEQIGAALFPSVSLTPLARRFRTLALLFFPLAHIVGFVLLVYDYPPPVVKTTIDGAQAISIARKFAIEQGIPADTWASTIKYSADSSKLMSVNARAERRPLWRIAPPISAAPILKAPGGKESVTVAISVDGRVLGFDWKDPSFTKTEISDDVALLLAHQQIARLPAEFVFGAPALTNKDGDRTFVFRSASVPGNTLRAVVVLRGSRVISSTVKADLTDEAAATSDNGVQTGLTLAGVCFLCLVAVFSIYRYISRTLQQEVSHQRSLVVALLCGCFCVAIGMNAVVNTSVGEVPLTVILIVFAVLGLMGGALLAAAYGSGEGDVREAYPGKLTSLDALLSGGLFSRNVGASVLFGIACAGWLTLLLGLAGLLSRTGEPQGSEELGGPFVRFGSLMPFVMYPLMSLGLGAAGLLQPLAFLQRHGGRFPRLHIPVLLVCAGLVSTMRAHSHSNVTFLFTSLMIVLALLLPFFELDLLASLVCVGVSISVLGFAGSVVGIPVHATRSLTMHVVALLGLTVFALISIRHGRICSEDQVRPLYARHIVERKSLEAEVSAAREAQLRLLPESVPEFSGLHISAVCVPAETVGGDFYDFFSLGDGRLGVFIAEGNNRGLAAALTIALAKGFLMHSVERSSEPVEILSRLETALASIFSPAAGADDDSLPVLTEFAFAAIDTRERTIRYARTAAYPRVVVSSSHHPGATERMVPVKGRATPIAEGWASFEEGDHILLFTDGIGHRLASGNRRPEEVAASLAREAGEPDRVRDAVLHYAGASDEPDDLTLIVIRATAQAVGESSPSLRVVA